MQPFKQFSSRVVRLVRDDIDTDQIIPARFLKVTDKNGLATNLFADWRYENDGSPRPDFVLNQAESQGAQILLAGDNFGCGSSREHAPWALSGYGFRAVIATSFGDIFRNNALKNGLLPVQVDANTHELIQQVLDELPRAEVTIDLENQRVLLPTGDQAEFPIDPFARLCLLQGTDELGYLMSFADQIAAYEQAHEGQEAAV